MASLPSTVYLGFDIAYGPHGRTAMVALCDGQAPFYYEWAGEPPLRGDEGLLASLRPLRGMRLFVAVEAAFAGMNKRSALLLERAAGRVSGVCQTHGAEVHHVLATQWRPFLRWWCKASGIAMDKGREGQKRAAIAFARAHGMSVSDHVAEALCMAHWLREEHGQGPEAEVGALIEAGGGLK